MAPGTTSDAPKSPPIASTATRTPPDVLRVGAGSVTRSARCVVGGRLGGDRQAAVVVAAVRADVMLLLLLVAVRTLLEVRQVDGEMRSALALAGVRDAALGYTHEVAGSLSEVGRVAWPLDRPGSGRGATPTAESTA